MRLSDAIALGRTILTPWTMNQQSGGGCALQIAAAATGDSRESFSDFPKRWPWLNSWEPLLPCDCWEGKRVMGPGMSPHSLNRKMVESMWCDTIIHMFNHHVVCTGDWNLDELIDWVRSVEPKEIEAAPEKRIAELAPSLVEQV